jgi:hypothetical protein
MQAEAGQIDPASGKLLSGARAGQVPKYHGRMWWSNAATLVQEGGVSGLWRGACPLVVRGALLAAGQMLGYDGLKTYCKRSACADDQSVFCYVPCGCFAVLANRSWQVYPDWLRTAIAHLFYSDCFVGWLVREGILDDGPTVRGRQAACAAALRCAAALTVLVVHCPSITYQAHLRWLARLAR